MEDERLHRKQHLAAPFRLFACYGFDKDEMQLRRIMEVYSSLTHAYVFGCYAVKRYAVGIQLWFTKKYQKSERIF